MCLMKRTIILTEEQINTILNKKPITVLWLDDMRDPNKYLNKKADKESGALYNNLSFYQKFKEEYNPEFVWVKTFEEFTNYILKNGVPEFVSFDHDLGKGLKKGAECALWLKQYCRENNKPLPKFYAHSANPNGRKEINSLLSSDNINENVYVNGVDRRNKKVNITYNTGDRMVGRVQKYVDNVGTKKMDQNNADTYEVDLKGGITSYNITSIQGTKVMHYFKNYFKNQATTVDVVDDKNRTQSYEMEMEKAEFDRFMRTFIEKVNAVVNKCVTEFKSNSPDVEFSGISIYPVKSSSNFNIEMARELKKRMPNIHVVDENLFNKDLANLRKDTEFIERNKEYYSKQAFERGSDSNMSSEEMVDSEMWRLQAIRKAQTFVSKLDELGKNLIRIRNSRGQYIKSGTYHEYLYKNYKEYYDTYMRLISSSSYVTNFDGKSHKVSLDKIANLIKYSKGPSIEKRSGEIWREIRNDLRGEKSINGEPYRQIDIGRWDPTKFEIKNSYNNVRMGLMGYYSKNPEVVKKEMDQIQNSIFIIFDDNISGGATLADICYLAKSMGLKYIIPITFGEMGKKYTAGLGKIKVFEPTEKTSSGFVTDFEYTN